MKKSGNFGNSNFLEKLVKRSVENENENSTDCTIAFNFAAGVAQVEWYGHSGGAYAARI